MWMNLDIHQDKPLLWLRLIHKQGIQLIKNMQQMHQSLYFAISFSETELIESRKVY